MVHVHSPKIAQSYNTVKKVFAQALNNLEKCAIIEILVEELQHASTVIRVVCLEYAKAI